jgi:hypothetical protein
VCRLVRGCGRTGASRVAMGEILSADEMGAEALISLHLEKTQGCGGPLLEALSGIVLWEIPRPVGKSTGLRDDTQMVDIENFFAPAFNALIRHELCPGYPNNFRQNIGSK